VGGAGGEHAYFRCRARMSQLFELSPTALSFVLVIGAITCFFMALRVSGRTSPRQSRCTDARSMQQRSMRSLRMKKD